MRCSASRRREAAPRPSWQSLAIAILPLALFAACSRTSIAPAIAGPTLDGNWTLVPAESDFRMMVPRVVRHRSRSRSRRTRTAFRCSSIASPTAAPRTMSWHVITDGKWHAVDGMRSRERAARRGSNGRLTLCMKGPGAHSETAEAWISGGRLICDGDTERGHFHAVFQRKD